MSDSTMLQYILIPMLMTVATHFLSRLENINIDSIKTLFTEFKWENFGKKSNSVFLTGERIRSVCHYSGESNVVESFTNTFSAIWEYIVKNNIHNCHELTELNNKSSSSINNDHTAFFFVSQSASFLIDKELQ